MQSVWSASCALPPRPKLDYDLITDTVVIGAGLAGLLTAYMLSEKGVKVVVIDASKTASGQTQNTTAKITSGHGLIYGRLIKNFGRELAAQYAQANELAIRKYEETIKNRNIDCDFERKPSYVYTLDKPEKIEDEVKAAFSLGLDTEYTEVTTLPFGVKAAIKYNNQAQFNPLKFISNISSGLTIFEDTKALDIQGTIVVTENAKITAQNIVVATHFPFLNTPGYYFARMHQERSYAIALKGAAQLDGMYIDEAYEGLSFRNYQNLLILGGGHHRTGENKEGGKYALLRKAAKYFYPGSREVFHWSAQDCTSIDNIPYIGQYSSSTPNIFVATGFNKWGMTSSMVSAILISGMICGEKSDYAEVFSPSRFNITSSIKNMAFDTGKSIKGLAVTGLKLPESKLERIGPGCGGVVDYNDKIVGVYKHNDGTVYTVSPTCTHLGCRLEWNSDELSWDCPCHGSRFDYTGKLIDNPALKNLYDE